MQHVVGEDRNQFQIISLEQLVPENSWARVIDLFVDLLPLVELGFKHSTLQNEGRPPYDPAMLLKLYLYGYKHSIRSSRKLEHSCKVNVELWWLLKGLTPSFRTIAYFRKDNSNAFTATFKRFVLMLKDLYLIEGETIAIDSFKIFAQNSIRNNFTQKKIERHLDYIDKKVAEYEAQLNESDAEDKAMLKEKIELKLDRRKKYEELNKILKDSGESQISLTDKDAKALMLANNISGVGFNIQAAADAKNKLLVHSHIGGTTDKRELATVALKVKELLGKETFDTLSDAGYSTGDQLSLCKDYGICTYSSPMPSTSPFENCLPLSSFIYNNEENCYICPSGERMTCGSGWINRGHYKSKIYKTKACKKCQIREICTKNKGGRIIERSEFQDIIDENNRRVLDNPDYYKLRRAIIEHPFGTLKRQWGFTFTIMRGKTNVMSEAYILMIIYNLKRCLSILGETDFRDKIRSRYTHFLCYYRPICYKFNNNYSSHYLKINLMRA